MNRHGITCGFVHIQGLPLEARRAMCDQVRHDARGGVLTMAQRLEAELDAARPVGILRAEIFGTLPTFRVQVVESARVVAAFLDQHAPGRFAIYDCIPDHIQFLGAGADTLYRIIVDDEGIHPGLSATDIRNCIGA